MYHSITSTFPKPLQVHNDLPCLSPIAVPWDQAINSSTASPFLDENEARSYQRAQKQQPVSHGLLTRNSNYPISQYRYGHVATATTEVPQVFIEWKKELLENLPNRTEGLNIERVESFLKDRGLPLTPYRILYPEDMKLFREICEFGPDEYLPDVYEETGGFYISYLDIVVVKRFPDWEHQNGAIITERVLIHELTHGAQKIKKYMIKPFHLSPMRYRIGFRILDIPHYGTFLEEGFAELMAGQYVQKYADRGFYRQIEALLTPEMDCEFIKKYGFVLNDYITCLVSSYAAEALSRLIHHGDPKGQLGMSLRDARISVDGLRRVARELNRIEPGLYAKISRVPYDDASFKEMLNVIIGILNQKEPVRSGE